MSSNLESAIPLADDDSTEEITEVDILKLSLGSGNKAKAVAAIQQTSGANQANAMSTTDSIPFGGSSDSFSPAQPSSLDSSAIDLNPDEIEERERLISQVLELQNTLEDLSQRVDNVKEENLKLKSENQVLGQYIENLMAASSVFQSTSPKVSSKTSSNNSTPVPNFGTSTSTPSASNNSPSGSSNSVRV